MKRTRKFLALFLAMLMLFAMGVTSFAAENDTKEVTVYFIQRDTTKPNNPTSDIIQGRPVEVTSNTTIKDAVDGALEGIGEADWVTSGEIVYLNGINIEGDDYINNYDYTQEDGKTRYTGTSWMWNYDEGTDYPEYYMNQATVGNHNTIYLIYETSSFLF